MQIITHSFYSANIICNMKEKYFRAFWANFVIVAVLIGTFAVATAASIPDIKSSAVAGNAAIYEGSDESGGVALMFNVYENAENVQKIADMLLERGYSTTFFIGGSWAAKNPNTLLRIAAAGFEIGNHGYLHRDHSALSLKQNTDEILLTERLIDSVLSSLPDYKNCKLFAPPSGSLGDNMFAACAKLDYRVIMWTRDTIDWRDHDADVIFDRAIKGLSAGDLVLMHPTDATLEALPRILDYLDSVDLHVAKVSDVIGQN